MSPQPGAVVIGNVIPAKGGISKLLTALVVDAEPVRLFLCEERLVFDSQGSTVVNHYLQWSYGFRPVSKFKGLGGLTYFLSAQFII